MQRLKSLGVLAAVALWSAPLAAQDDGASDTPPGVAPTSTRTAFVIGAPGRLDSEGDRRAPRLYQRGESAVAAYVDVEIVQDPTWLRHELEHYARRVVDCTGLAPAWCRRQIRRMGTASVIDLASGEHAELVWLSGANRAIRLGWRRIVETGSGTMTVDAPPAEFAADVLDAFPVRPQPFEVDGAAEPTWRADETDRLLYYADQVVASLPAVAADIHRRHAVRFVEEALAQIGRLGARPLDGPAGEPLPDVGDDIELASDALPPQLADQLDAVRTWRRGILVRPWCAADLISSSAMSFAATTP